MSQIHPSIACNLDADILAAAIPLFEQGKVAAIEWSFDTLFKTRDIPSWFVDLLDLYSKEGRLIGHGVFFSLFSGKWSQEQEGWLAHLKKVSTHFRFEHITEHFGFMTGKNFHEGAPISLPFNASTLAIGQDRLRRIQQTCQCPVGLENLAFAYSLEEVKQHGAFLDALVTPVNGFVILDLHNLYCQLHNFEINSNTLLDLYPLEKVREIHISGGSWDENVIDPGKKIRRDTHDSSVPAEVFTLLENTIPRCPNLRYVVLEQLGNALTTPESRAAFGRDFLILEEIIQRHNTRQSFATETFMPPANSYLAPSPVEDDLLYQQQRQLSAILETAANHEEAFQLLRTSALANSDWGVEHWHPAMLETAVRIAQKWRRGWVS